MSFLRPLSRVFVVLLLLGVPQSSFSKPAPSDLKLTMTYVADVLEGKLVRHENIRDYLNHVFLNQDGRDRYLLNLVALVRRGGILNGKIRRLQWEVEASDEVYGYAETRLKACGFWYMWIPRCVEVPTNWRRIDDRWYVLPPEQIRLDPEIKRFLRRL